MKISKSCRGSLISKRDLIVGLFYFLKNSLKQNFTCLFVQRKLFQMIFLLRYMLYCYDISQETELKKRPVLKLQSLAGSWKWSTLANFLGQHYNCEFFI